MMKWHDRTASYKYSLRAIFPVDRSDFEIMFTNTEPLANIIHDVFIL